MSKTAIIGALIFALTLTGCGGLNGMGNGNIDGYWTATLTDSDGLPVIAFQTQFTQGNGSILNVVNFSFTNAGTCFASQETTETGSFSFQGDFHGHVSGAFDMTIQTTGADKIVLKLHGTVQDGKITGTWTLTGSVGCTGNGVFAMTPGW